MHAVNGQIDLVVLDSLLKNLCYTLKQSGAIRLKVRTPFPFPYGYKIFSKNGFTREIVKGEYSVFIDLRKDLATLWKEMKRFARRSVEKAIERGVEVKGVETEMDLHQFYRMYVETALRRGFKAYPYRFFDALWTQLEPKGLVKFFIASWKKKPIGGILNTSYAKESVPYISCSLRKFWDHHPNHILFWHSIKWSKEVAGSSLFKLYHVSPKRERIQGVDYYSFKTCFGGDLLEERTFYRKIISPAKFKIFKMFSIKSLPKSRITAPVHALVRQVAS